MCLKIWELLKLKGSAGKAVDDETFENLILFEFQPRQTLVIKPCDDSSTASHSTWGAWVSRMVFNSH